jgi:hypothetical protein
MAERKKIRRARKPMTPEQKEAAVARLAKAREERAKNNPPEYKSIHSSVLELDDEKTLCMKNVKQWIKTQRELLAVAKQEERKNVPKARAKVYSIQGYIRNMESYLRTGVWSNLYYGEYEDQVMKNVCIKMAYDEDGNASRNVNTYYADIGGEWTQEIDKEDRAKRQG